MHTEETLANKEQQNIVATASQEVAISKILSLFPSYKSLFRLSQSPSWLCRSCSALNLPEVFTSNSRSSLESRNRPTKVKWLIWRTSPCSLCRLFAVMTPKPYENNLSFLYLDFFSATTFDTPTQYEARDLGYGIPHGENHPEITLLGISWNMFKPEISVGVVPTSNATKSSPSERGPFGVRLIKPDAIDYRVLKDWIALCQRDHTSNTSFCSVSRSVSFPSRKLIDCRDRRIVRAPDNCQYVALSYVWGCPTEQNINPDIGDRLPRSVPPTIKDAMTVTLGLGFQYLWVDRYCILQTDRVEMATQIGQMDSIYTGADVTIVATFGDGPHCGLPGVGRTQRKPQFQTAASGLTLATIPSFPGHIVGDSKWNSRGWTYQEALLSRRKLFFTEHQVLFSCSGMHCFESLHSSRRPGSLVLGNDGDHRSHGIPPCGPGLSPWDIFDRIAEYGQRELTHESDALNGFMGVLRAFEHFEYPVYHYWGVPIIPPIATGKGKSPVRIQRSSLDGFILGLCWTWGQSIKFLNDDPRRRPGFPSWSWVGWTGSILPNDFNHPWEPNEIWDSKTGIKITIELNSGKQMLWEEFERTSYLKTELSIASHFIHIDAWTVPITFQYIGDSDYMSTYWLRAVVAHSKSHFFTLDLPENTRFSSSVAPDRLEMVNAELAQHPFTGVILGQPIISPEIYPFVIVVEEKDGFAERIASITIGQSCAGATPGGSAGMPPGNSWAIDSFQLIRKTIRLG